MSDTDKARLDRALTDLFRGLEARCAPEHILRIVDQLERANPRPAKAA